MIPGGISGKTLPMSRIIFNKYALEEESYITRDKFQSLVQDHGYRLSLEELEMALKRLDDSGDGNIQYEEFLAWWRQEDRFGKLKPDEEGLKLISQASEIFREFDTDKSGFIDLTEFDAVYHKLKAEGIAKKDKEATMAHMDHNDDKKISFNEYIEWLKHAASISFKALPVEVLPKESTASG